MDLGTITINEQNFTSTTTLDNLLKDPLIVQLDLLANYAAHVLKGDGQEMAGVEGSQVGKGGLLGPRVPNMRQVFVHIGDHYWLLRVLVSTPSERMDDFLGKKNISYK